MLLQLKVHFGLCVSFFHQTISYVIFTRGQFWPWVIGVACVSVCMSVCQPRACARDNYMYPPVPDRAYKLGQQMQKHLDQDSCHFGGWLTLTFNVNEGGGWGISSGGGHLQPCGLCYLLPHWISECHGLLVGVTWLVYAVQSVLKGIRGYIITSSNGHILRVTGPLCGEFTGDRWIPLTKASDAELWCFLRYVPE